jgi:manganese oxidase
MVGVWRYPFVVVMVGLVLAPALAEAQGPAPSPLLPAGTTSGLPVVAANDNRTPAGVERGGAREVDLRLVWADWRIESPAGPGLRVAAVAEAGGAPSVPAPMIRIEAGTRVRVRVANELGDLPVRVFGLHTRREPASVADTLPAILAPGATEVFEFEAGEPGTYLYWFEEGAEPPADPNAEREQLAGALVVDPAGGSPEDRVMVINIYSEPVDTAVSPSGWLEGLTINGVSWPYGEHERLEVGERVRWRVVNASIRNHPMHLHGFYFSVRARGTASGDTLYAERDWRSVVTETMRGRSTMLMEWVPTRPGRWLFHCHLSFHVTPHIRLPGAVEADTEHAHAHMAGLAVGIDVAPGPTDLISRGEPVTIDLYAREYGDVDGYRYGFALDPEFAPDSLTEAPGPPLVFNQYQAVNARVHNRLPVATGVHWHGLELDAWADGVPGWSASDGRVSPAIAPGESFTYKLSLLRPGTFIYHSHLDDIAQLTGGLYGPLIVLPEGEVFDPATDHILIWGWNTPDASEVAHLDLNGRRVLADGAAAVGERHRFRLINIAPAGMFTAWITGPDGERVPFTLFAKDGADLPTHQQVEVTDLPRLGVGETADFTWTPLEPGVYELRVGYNPQVSLVQRWVVS